MGMDGGDGAGRVSSIRQCRRQSDHGAIWVWHSMNTGSRLPDGAGGAQRCPEERGEMAGV